MPGCHASTTTDDLSQALEGDAALWRLVHSEAEANQALARGLAALWDRELYRPLAFVRATDFVREHLGIRESRARWLARLGRRLLEIPEFDRALAARRMSGSHILELGAIVDATTPAEELERWIERARATPIRAFRKLVRSVRKKGAPEDPDSVSGIAAGPEVTVVDLRAGADPGNPGSLGADSDEHPAGGWMSIPAPARVAVLWHAAVDLARAAAGRHATQGQCAEMIIAEYLSAHPAAAGEPPAASDAGDARERLLGMVMDAMNRAPRRGSGAPAATAGDTAASAAGETPASAGKDPLADTPESYAKKPLLDWRIPDGELPAGCVTDAADPWQTATALARLAHWKKRLRYDIAAWLARLHHDAPWHAFGFASFAAYCEERLGFGLRRAERLIRFHAGLNRFPLLRQAYLDGGLSYTAVLLLLPILHRTTEEAWVRWADGITYRELERVAEYARTYALPDAHPSVLESWVRELERQGLASKVGTDEQATAFAAEADTMAASAQATAFAAEADTMAASAQATAFAAEADTMAASAQATAFAAEADTATASAAPDSSIPLGYALPPTAPRALPIISGIPEDITLAPPELCIARIRFWLPADALDLAYRALHSCRRSMPDSLRETWVYLEIILVHFFNTHDTPLARALARRHRIIARDNYMCCGPGCMSRTNLQDHHLDPLAQGGSDDPTNRASLCAGHLIGGQHAGVLDMGGWAPDRLTTKLGINPKNGEPLACYRNERRVSAECAEADLAAWRASLRGGAKNAP